MTDNTVFDSVFKTMAHKMPKLMIPFINEVFGRDYPDDEAIVQFSNEHESLRGTKIDDSVFRVRNKIYHVECQSTADASMVIRMIEYDFAIALEQTLAAGKPYEMDFPSSCVLFLRHDANTPDELRIKVNLPNGGSFDYTTKVVKAQLYSGDELVRKRLLLLIPYYLMRYEQTLAQIAADDVRTAQLLVECAELRASLEELTLATGDTILYEQLVELIIRVSDHMLAAYETLRKKVRRAMGGEVLELWRERAARLEQEARELGIELGIERGIEQGVEQGIEQGIEQGVDDLARRLRERGVDDALIDEAIASMKQERELGK